MMAESLSVLRPFILSWNLRNIIDHSTKLFHEKSCILGTCLGEYPIDAWNTFFLELPRNGYKKDISGRHNNAFSLEMRDTEWNNNRIVPLPVYRNFEYSDIEIFKLVIKHWVDISLPDDIPCLALAIKRHGNYSDTREAQTVKVLLIWHDAVCRIITLDWFEGPLEDCITPEWYINSTPLLNLHEALEKIRNFFDNSLWDNTAFSIFTIPSCLGRSLHGTMMDSSYMPWEHEWRYNDYTELNADLTLILSEIQNIFSKYSMERELHG